MAAKLCLTNPEQTSLLAQYVFNLAKYDTNYDIRDRARFLRAFVFPPPGAEDNKLVAVVIVHGDDLNFASPQFQVKPPFEAFTWGETCYTPDIMVCTASCMRVNRRRCSWAQPGTTKRQRLR